MKPKQKPATTNLVNVKFWDNTEKNSQAVKQIPAYKRGSPVNQREKPAPVGLNKDEWEFIADSFPPQDRHRRPTSLETWDERNMSRWDKKLETLDAVNALVACPYCKAEKGKRCWVKYYRESSLIFSHRSRGLAALELANKPATKTFEDAFGEE